MTANTDIYTKLQRAETLLVQSSYRLNPDLPRKHIEQYGLDEVGESLLVRMASGLNPGWITPQDYLMRYPFSDLGLIRAGLDHMVRQGWMRKIVADNYGLTHLGREIVAEWIDNMGQMISALQLDGWTEIDTERLVLYNRRIICEIAFNQFSGPTIFKNRLQGMQPNYRSPELWHHWQLVWSMIAAREDAEWNVLAAAEMNPMTWFVRRQVWFVDRKPWLVRSGNLEQLERRANSYAPVPEGAALRAVDELIEHGWMQPDGEYFRLTEAGLAETDEAEAQVEENFFSYWPQFSDDERDEIAELSSRLNELLERTLEQVPVAG